MSGGLVTKIRNFIGFANYIEEEDDDEVFKELYHSDSEYQSPTTVPTDVDSTKRIKSNLKVVSHPNANSHEVMVIEPRSFDESLEIIHHLRERKSIVLNLHLLAEDQSQRVVDFLSGATHAIDGHQQRIGSGVFMFTPANVPILAEVDKTKAIKDAFWNNSQ